MGVRVGVVCESGVCVRGCVHVCRVGVCVCMCEGGMGCVGTCKSAW